MFVIVSNDLVWGKISDGSGSIKKFTHRTNRAVKYKSRANADRILALLKEYAALDKSSQYDWLQKHQMWDLCLAKNGQIEAAEVQELPAA